jgi:hypothetical protein
MLALGKTIAALSLLSFAACAEVGAAQTEAETTDELAVAKTDAQRPIPADRLGVHTNALGAPGEIAFGTISTTGAKITGSANWSSVLNTASHWYEVTITGESYFFSSYATKVTPMNVSSTAFCTTDSAGGKLLIACHDLTGTLVSPLVAFSTSKP